jgi:hypothetical protein
MCSLEQPLKECKVVARTALAAQTKGTFRENIYR